MQNCDIASVSYCMNTKKEGNERLPLVSFPVEAGLSVQLNDIIALLFDDFLDRLHGQLGIVEFHRYIAGCKIDLCAAARIPDRAFDGADAMPAGHSLHLKNFCRHLFHISFRLAGAGF